MIRPGADEKINTAGGVDTDQDGLPDTVVLTDPVEVLLAVDLDRDQLADLIVRIAPDGVAETIWFGPTGPGAAEPWPPTDPAADLCTDPLWPLSP
jgi:hypothetical protein